MNRVQYCLRETLNGRNIITIKHLVQSNSSVFCNDIAKALASKPPIEEANSHRNEQKSMEAYNEHFTPLSFINVAHSVSMTISTQYSCKSHATFHFSLFLNIR